jgi:uncharacterized repeat protein (TIGR01451 family)
MFKRYNSTFLLLFLLLPFKVFADSCASPTAVLTLGVTKTGQEINEPYIDGDAASGSSLYYQVDIVEDGTLTLTTAEDVNDPVNTYGYLLDSSCTPIATATKYQDNPRLVTITQSVQAGKRYYFKVENNATSSDSILYARGFFQLKNSFARTIPPHEISISKSTPYSVDAGENFSYTITIHNSGTEDTKSVTITEKISKDFSYQSYSSTADWNCTQSGLDMSCTLNSGVIASGSSQTLTFNLVSDYISLDTNEDANTTVDVTYNTAGTINLTSNKEIILYKANPTISLTKSAIKSGSLISSILQGESFAYKLEVKNSSSNSNIIEDKVIIVDDVDSNFTVESITPDVASDWNCSASSGQHVECHFLPDLSTGSVRSIMIGVKAVGAIQAESYHNKAIVTAHTPLDTTISFSHTIPMTIVGPEYSTIFTKTNPDSSVVVENNTTYRLYVQNTSNVPLDGVRIVDVIPDEFNISKVETYGFDWTCQPLTSNKIDCSYDNNLSVGESSYFDVVLLAKVEGTNIVNTATLSTPHTADKNASKSIDIVSSFPSDLGISKGASQNVVLENDSFYYTLIIYNAGASQENNITVFDTIPSDFTVENNISATDWNCTLSGNDVSCILDTLASGAFSNEITIWVHAPSKISVDKKVTNSAKVTSSRNSTGVTASRDVTLLSPNNAIKIHLDSAPNPVYAGESFTYSVFITNNSQKTTDSVTLYDTLPADVLLESIDSGDWSCEQNSTTKEISCNTNGNALTGLTKQIDFHVRAPNYEVNVTNHVQLKTDLDPYWREANVTTEVLQKSDALRFKESSVSKDPVTTDERFSYTIKIENENTGKAINDINASSVKLEIALDSNLSIMGMDANGWNCIVSGSMVECLLANDLAVGEEAPTIKIDVNSSIAHYAITDLNLTSDSQKDGILASIPVDILDKSTTNFSLTLKDDKDPVAATGEFSYLVDVKNSGSMDAHGIDLVLETVSSDNFVYNGLTGTGWVCSQSGMFVNCHLDTLVANSTSTLSLHVTAPDINDTLQVNASLSSSVTQDSDSSDNNQSETTQVLQLDTGVDNLRDFSQIMINGNSNTNIYGDVITIGNQAICQQGGAGECVKPEYEVNDWVFQVHVNLDSKSSYESSTMATLDITDDDEVIWAGLYWMGIIDRNAGDSDKIDRADHVYLRHESEGSYIEVESDLTKFNWKNDITWGADTFGYQGVANVTEYVKAHKKGDYWVADIQTTDGYNLSAGWTLVVVVQDKTQTRSLKNITLFDGFQAVWKNTEFIEANQYPDFVTQSVSGFLTPNAGPVNSKLSLFALEGDESLKDSISLTDESNTSHKLSNALNPIDDIANGTISNNDVLDTQRVPALSNTSGVDIDTFDVSEIIGNGQSSTDITIASEGDRFYLGMFAFSTELYLPKMCYIETMTNPDYTPLTNDRSFRLGDRVGFEVSLQNDENETASNVELKVEVDVIYRDTKDTLEIKNIGDSDYNAHTELWDTWEINSSNDQNETVPQTIFKARIGAGANSSIGGDMNYQEKIFFHYNSIIDGMPESNTTQNIYKISYNIDNMPAVVETTIKKCYDFNQSIYVSQANPKGFSITHHGGLTDGVSDNSGNENHLFTQLTDTNFQVDIVSLEDDYQTSRVHKGVVRLDLVDVNSTIPANASDAEVENICKSYATLSTLYVSLDDESRISPTISYHDSGRNLGFRILYPLNKYNDYAQWQGVDSHSLLDFSQMLKESYISACQNECSPTMGDIDSCRTCVFGLDSNVSQATCSSDSFAIRPKTIKMDVNETILKGGKDYNLTLEANATRYNQSFPTNALHYTLVKPAGCSLPNEAGTINPYMFSFTDGNASIATFSYHNVGDINVSILDDRWTLVDQNSSDSLMSDCIVGSDSNTPIGGKYGCNLRASKEFSFVASRFKNVVDLENDNFTTFTYFDGTGTRRARAFMTITALIDDNTTASNYTGGCFANDINYTFGPKTTLPAGLTMNLYSDTNTAHVTLHQFKTAEGNFTNGIAYPVLGINFARSKTTPMNPYDLNSSQLYIYLEDTNGISGDGFAVDTGVARYYYTRLYAPDYLSIESSNFRAGLFYEVYCDEDSGCDKNAMGLGDLVESRDHINWYIFNKYHSFVFGGYALGSVNSANGLPVSNFQVFSVDLNLSTTMRRPHCDRISLTPDSWFRYDEHDSIQADTLSFKSCFTSTGLWSGKGDVGLTIDSNISKTRNYKIDW